jgi:hypothetical protein
MKESSYCENKATEGGWGDPARRNSETGGIRLYQGLGQHGNFPGSLAGIEECNGGSQEEGPFGHYT